MAQFKRKYNKSLSGKFIIAVILAASAIVFSWLITKVTFRKMLRTVNQLSVPNPKLQLVNTIFRDVVTLDQLQRAQALQVSRKTYNPFLKESFEIKKKLDSLYRLSAGTVTQGRQIDSMKRILDERDKVFLNYLGLRKDFIINDTLTSQIKELSGMIGMASTSIDSNVVTTEKKITTTTIEEVPATQESKQSFWDRVLGRRKGPEKAQVKKLIQEELNIKIDTLATAKEDSVVQALSVAITNVEEDRLTQRNLLVKRQMELNRTGNLLISRVLGMLQDLESEELKLSAINNVQATELVNSGIKQINLILLAFVLGTVLLAFLFFTDIAGSNRYRKELIRAKEEAEELEQVKHRFLANMSHELRTPLQAIVGLAEQVKLKGFSTTKDTDTIFRSSQHLLQIVNEVLDYSRIVSGKFNIDQHRFQMDELLEEIKNVMTAQTISKSLAFHLSTDKPYTTYIGDPFRLKQILYNLLGNAIKFTDSGAVTLSVTAKEFNTRTSFSFKIKDTGIGITAEDQERIFSQFEQGNTSFLQNHEGTGLGLSIVKSLVEIQKGTLSLDSTPGEGSEFTVVMSYANVKEDSVQHALQLKITQDTVWVIDDDALILDLCKTILDKHNIPNKVFSNAHDALNTMVDDQVNVIFIDIRMPKMNGFEACNKLRKQVKDGVKMIALTAQALPEDREHILQNGFDALLVKPFLEKDFLQFLSHTTEEISFDFGKLMKMTNGDHDLLQKIIRTFVTETKKDADKIKQAIEEQDTKNIADYLHKLSGRFAQVGAASIARQLRETEMNLRTNKGYNDQCTPTLLHLCSETVSFTIYIQDQFNVLIKNEAT